MNLASIKNQIHTVAKFADQPNIVKAVSDSVPIVLIGGASVYAACDTFADKSKTENLNKKFMKNSIVLAFTVASSLIAARGLPFLKNKQGQRVFQGYIPAPNVNEIKLKAESILKQIKNKKELQPITSIVEKAKTKILSLNDINILKKHSPEYLETLIPSPKPHGVKQIFGEIFNLSMLGAIPVLGGIAGGIAADKASGENIKEKLPNKIKEGFYQFFANIFLCNVGAGVALGLLEGISKIPDLLKDKIKIENSAINSLKLANTKLPRAIGMITGITLVGIMGGSSIANWIGKSIINPLLGTKEETKTEERKPELLDVALHSDDIATVGVLSGFKWIEPALPLLYAISGYRAGTGYRGHGHKSEGKTQNVQIFNNTPAFTAKNIELEKILAKNFK